MNGWGGGLRAGGELLLSVPHREENTSTTLVPPLAALETSGAEWRAPARLSGEPALVVYRPILYQDLRISASVPQADALANWRDQRNAITITGLLFAAMIAAAGWLALRYLDRISQARSAIAQSKATLDQALESMVSGFLLLDSSQRVVQWNSRFEEIFPWLRAVMAPGVSFRRLLEEKQAQAREPKPWQSIEPGGGSAERRRW